jgi:acyl-CoA synthetase (AMP-forming)/AMP-acid ligase II
MTPREDSDRNAPPATLPEALRIAARRRPDRIALRWDDGSLTFDGLAACVDGIAAHLLERGVRPGDRVALCAAADR